MAITPNQSIFRNIASQMPGQNKQVATGLQEAAKTQMQAQLGGMQPMGQPMGIRQVQQAGAQATAAQAQPLLQVQQQGQQQAAQLGQLAVQQQQADVQKQLQERQFNMQKSARDMEKELANLNQGLKNRLVDEQFNFQKDELGRTSFNERQLVDYKLATAKSNLELRELEQKMRQGHQRRLQVLKAAQAKLEAELKQEFSKGQQELDQAQAKELAEASRRMKEKIRRAEAEARNRGSLISSAFTIGGAILGAGTPLTAAGGAMVGQGLGQGFTALFPNL